LNTAHPKATVSPTYFFHVLGIAEELGVKKTLIADRLAMNLSIRPSAKTRYSLEQFDALLNIVAEELNDPHLGLNVGERFRIATYTDLGNILAFCKDLEEAAYINKRYSSLVHTLGVPDLTKEDFGQGVKDIFLWEPNFPKEDYQKFRHITEYVLSNYVSSLNWLAWGFGKGVSEIHYAHSPASPISEYDRLMRCNSRFDTDIYRIVMADDIMNIPLPTANAQQLDFLKTKQDAILNSFNMEDNLILRVEDSILTTIRMQKPNIECVSKSIGMSARSLKRHLKDQDTSFREILERVKRRMCENLIAEGLGLAQIAQVLWYSDQAAFTRAYKKWHGVPPSRHKKPHINQTTN